MIKILSTTTVLLFSLLLAGQDHFGAGQDNGVIVSSSSQSLGTNQQNTINGFGLDAHLKDASRFLGQATFGPDYELIEQVGALGPANWIDQQFATPLVSYRDTSQMIWDHYVEEYIATWGEENIVDNSGIFPLSIYFRMAWWNNIMKAEDQLRQRVAFALSEIMVVSEKSQLQLNGLGLADYYDVLYRNSFGNFRQLIEEVTYHPAMGFYLSHLNNEKTDDVNNIHPDENYAREVMQLFTIGLFQLNQDGTHILDENDLPIATYDNSDIQEMAKIFTGLGPAEYWNQWGDFSSFPVEWDGPFNTVPTINLFLPMQMFEEWHEPGEKHLLNDFIVPDGQSGDEDISDALDNLFNHPNVGPFIGKQLIQKLVKSNPTPDYVSRVSAAFNDNGDGVRGDMQAVIKAILLDPEARSCEWIADDASGKLREPLIRHTQFMRAFNASNESDRLWNIALSLEYTIMQQPLASPSVFNFFLPGHQPNGPIIDAGLVAPEFQILTSATALNYINIIYYALLGDFYMEVGTLSSSVDIGFPELNPNLGNPDDVVSLDFSSELDAVDNPTALVDRLDLMLTGGIMSEETKLTITETLETLVVFDLELAVKTAIFLTLISPDYVIQK